MPGQHCTQIMLWGMKWQDSKLKPLGKQSCVYQLPVVHKWDTVQDIVHAIWFHIKQSSFYSKSNVGRLWLEIHCSPNWHIHNCYLEWHPYISSLLKLKSVKLSILVRYTENLSWTNFSVKSTINSIFTLYVQYKKFGQILRRKKNSNKNS